jgi:hypothetical protein
MDGNLVGFILSGGVYCNGMKNLLLAGVFFPHREIY